MKRLRTATVCRAFSFASFLVPSFLVPSLLVPSSCFSPQQNGTCGSRGIGTVHSLGQPTSLLLATDQDTVANASNSGDDGVSKRFKYKVNALMGVFDPPDETKDNEHVDGNILNAMLVFPTDYTFHIVGKTSADLKMEESFVDDVKSTLISFVDEPIRCVVTPRGRNFTKVSVTVNVSSAATISTVYQKLGAMPLSVMQF